MFFVVLSAHAGETPQKTYDHLVQATLVSEARVVAPGKPFWVAVRLKIAGGWHVNWLNPGDAGLAPTVAWELPEGYKVGRIQWPYPRRFDVPELSIFGYEHEVLLAAQITPPASLDGGSISLRAKVGWLACREVCVPGEAEVELGLPVGDETLPAPNWVGPFDKARQELPVVADGWQFGAHLTGEKLLISAAPPAGDEVLLEDVFFFPTAEGLIENASPQTLHRDGSSYELVIDRAVIGLSEPSRIEGVLVSNRGWGRIENRAIAIDIPLNP